MDLILEILSISLVQSILKIAFIILLFAMPLGTVLTLMERKWSAMIQDRVGPCLLYTSPSPRDTA